VDIIFNNHYTPIVKHTNFETEKRGLLSTDLSDLLKTLWIFAICSAFLS